MVHSLRLPLVLALAVLFCGSSSGASAAPITLNFTGQFMYIDFEYLAYPRTGAGVDDAWAFDEAIRSTGAVTSQPGQLVVGNFRFSLTFDTNAVDVDPSPGMGWFDNAVTGKFWFGDTMFSMGPTTVVNAGGLSFAPPASFTGPTIPGGGYTYQPPGLTLHPLTSPLLNPNTLGLGNFASALSWTAPTVLFNWSGSQHVVAGSAQVVSVSVPEATTLSMLSSAIVAFFAWRRSISRRRTPAA